MKNIIFDFGNVLAAFSPFSLARRFADTDADAVTLASVVFDGRWADYDGGRLSYDEHLSGSLARLPERLHEAAEALFAGWPAALDPIESTAETVHALYERGYGLYILSNAPRKFSEVVREHYPITHLFDGAVYSAAVGMDKPHAPIYQYLLDTYRLDPTDCLFVDDKAENVAGAEACGIRGYLYDGDGAALLRFIEAENGDGAADRGLVAERLFYAGHNCAQDVACAFCDKTGISRRLSMHVAAPFGGGMGRLREVCGTVSGMYLVLGALLGYDADSPTMPAEKKELYERVQELARRFREKNGTIICRELLAARAKNGPDDAQTAAMLSTAPEPMPRTAEYYKRRPCGRLVREAAAILDEYLKEIGDGTDLHHTGQ